MKEIIEFRIDREYTPLLLKPDEGKRNDSNTIIRISRDDPKFEQIKVLYKKLRQENKFLFLHSNIKRNYSRKELDTAPLLQMLIKTTFEPAGEECGTMYDETITCEICGANRTQINSLKLKKGSVPKKDIARTIAGEIVVSEKFTTVFKQRGLKGAVFEPVVFVKEASHYYQLTAVNELELSKETVAGINVFDLSESSEEMEITIPGGYDFKLAKEVYKCPRGHTIGLNLLSEAFVLSNPLIAKYDFFSSKQKIGVKRGLLMPEPLYLCSQAFRKMVEEEKLSGFEFEITHIQ